MRAVPQYFTAWFAKHLIAGLFGIASPLPLLPLYILVVGGCYSLDVCSHLGSFYLPVVFFIALFSMVFIIIIAIIILVYLISFH